MTLLSGLMAINLVILLVIIRMSKIYLDEAISELDGRLAMALQSVMDNIGMGDFEPPNPVQAAIGQLIQSWATQQMNTIPATVIDRESNGQFSPSNEPKVD
tara:strand:+ start:2361 stop:2663 length:303 start_codon:yes stop_codon:yes gene_type:complete